MRKPPASATISPTTTTVLSVSPITGDHTSLGAILERSEQILGRGSKWMLRPCATVESAMAALSQARIPVVVTERDLAPGSWRDILENVLRLPDPPMLIVTSRFADDYLWAEALNLGACDVLAKPFDTSAVVHVISSAWQRWIDRYEHIQFRHFQMMVATAGA